MRIPDLELGAPLYEGQSTLVYAGRRLSDGAAVIAKVVTGGLRDLHHEAHILGKVAGDGVVELIGVFDASDAGDAGDKPVLIQRRFGTGSLADLLRRGPRLPLASVLAIAVELARVLARVHAARVLHRDIKPANVLYDAATKRIALADFGLAVELAVGTRGLPRQDLVGTAGYVAPEQTGRMAQGCDHRSDLYSFGVTLYELLTASLPFRDRELGDLVAAHLSRLPEPPDQRAPSVPPIVSAIVMKLIAKQPDERYQSARGVAADLARCLASLHDGRSDEQFALALSDVVPLRFPPLFGRTAEADALRQALARTASGPVLVLITGRPDSGRRTLVEQALAASGAPLALGGWRAAGEPPLSGIADALSRLASRLVQLDEEDLAALRRAFAGRLGQIGQVVLDIAPVLADAFGTQPALAELGPAQTQARLHHAFRCLSAALSEEAPFALALTGAEHADAGSASLIEALLTNPLPSRALIVLVAEHAAQFGRLAEHPGAIAIELAGLTVDALAACITEMFGCSTTAAADLAELLHGKTGGHPLAFQRWIEHLLDTGAIDRRDGSYTWSLDAIRTAHPPPTLGALAAQRISELDQPHRRTLAAIACSDDVDTAAAAAALAEPADIVAARLHDLVRDGLIVASAAAFRPAHPAIGDAALATLNNDQLAELRSQLARHLLATRGDDPGPEALRIATLVRTSRAALHDDDRLRAARCCVVAGEHAARSLAYDASAELFGEASALLGASPWRDHHALAFRAELGLGRALMLRGEREQADAVFAAIFAHDLTPTEISVSYLAASDNWSMVRNFARAIDIGLAGLARLGVELPPEPALADSLAAVRRNQDKLAALTTQDLVAQPDATGQLALATMDLIHGLSVCTYMSRRSALYIAVIAKGLELSLHHGHFANGTTSLLCIHANLLRTFLGDTPGSRIIHQHCAALDDARPVANLAPVHVSLHWLCGPWYASWDDLPAKLLVAAQSGVEHGDPLFAALCAAGWLTMQNLVGTPFDRWAQAIEARMPFVRVESGLVLSWTVTAQLAGKLARGEPIAQADLDRVTSMPLQTAPMRNGCMTNFSLPLIACGHADQVRRWFDEIRDRMPLENFSQPNVIHQWTVDAVLAARDADSPERRGHAEHGLARLRTLRDQTGSPSYAAPIRLIEAELARASGDLDRAAGLFGRAVDAALAPERIHWIAYAMERRADMLAEAGLVHEARLYYREAIAAYRRWAHMTKVAQLEAAHPELYQPVFGRPRAQATAATSLPSSSHGSVRDNLDLATVQAVSQQISSQLHASGVVRAVLTGIARNAGAERAVLVLRDAGGTEIVYGEVDGADYRDVNARAADYAGLPRSVARVVRRTGRPVVVADAASDPGYRADPFVVANHSISIAGIPIRRGGEAIGFVVLENRLVAGAFTPELVSLTQTLVAQAAISLDNASLYEDMERRVAERTAALNARNAELRMVLDHVSQGLVMIGRDGRLLGERSAILDQWFPAGVPPTIAGLFDDPDSAALFEFGWDELIAGDMPREVCLAQLPRELAHRGRTFELALDPIADDSGAIAGVLAVVSDVTEARRRLAAEREQHELVAICERLATDRDGVIEFVREAAAIVGELARTPGASSRDLDNRLVHTLKGNAALFGLPTLARLCHDLESALHHDERELTDAERAQIAAAWARIYDKLQRFLEVSDDVMHVRKHDFDTALRVLRRDGHPMAHDLELWRLEPLKARFQRIAEQAHRLAERLGKAPLDVRIEHAGLRIHTDAWSGFWAAFAHAVRNAIDHGLEPPAERAQLGKPTATLTLRGYLDGGSLILELSDDGRGIAWDKLREVARAAGLPHDSERDLIAALVRDGISTSDAVTETSGRGVGMAALAAACDAIHAQLSVTSRAGEGTTWRFELPAGLAKLPRERSATGSPITAARA